MTSDDDFDDMLNLQQEHYDDNEDIPDDLDGSDLVNSPDDQSGEGNEKGYNAPAVDYYTARELPVNDINSRSKKFDLFKNRSTSMDTDTYEENDDISSYNSK